jgi:hypothetical protein
MSTGTTAKTSAAIAAVGSAPHPPRMVFSLPHPPQPLRPQSARVYSAEQSSSASRPLFRPQHSGLVGACVAAAPPAEAAPLPNQLYAASKDFHVIDTEPFFWKAEDPKYAPCSNAGPKYDPVYTLVRPRVRSASLKRTAARLALVKNSKEEQAEIDKKEMRRNAAAVARSEREAETLLERAKAPDKRAASPATDQEPRAAVSGGGSPRNGPVDPASAGVPPSLQTSVTKITRRLESARRLFSRSTAASTHYESFVGGHWTDGLFAGSSLGGQIVLSDRTVNARLPIYSIARPLEYLQPSPRGVSFSKTERFPSPRTSVRHDSSGAEKRPSRRDGVSMKSTKNLENSVNRHPDNVAS